MALSGTIYGSFTAMDTSKARPYIKWTATQSITGNTSTVTATLYFVRYDGYRSWSNDAMPFTITIDGTNNTQSKSYDMPGNGVVDTIFSASKVVTHDSDGSKKITIKASGATGLSNLGSVSISATITLDTIPRASTFTAFSLSNTTLNTSTTNTVTYTLGRQSTSFSQDMTLKLGSKVIKSWNTTGTGALTQSLSATEVNSIISGLPNATSGTLTLTMQTKNGSTNIGSSISRTVGISLSSAIVPTASGLSTSVYGSGRDKTINKFVQSISRVTASFTRTAGYGASISSSTITVKKSDGTNSQTISSNSGTTAKAVSSSGTYTVTGTVKDSRGRSASVSANITVHAYSVPKITKFTANRKSSPTTTVDNIITASWSNLGTDNAANITVIGIRPGGSSTTMYTLTGSTAGSLNTTRSYTSQLDTYSYTYTLTVTDSFNNKATATAKVSTSFVEFSISKGKGIGVGKVWEKGALDVNGDAYISGVTNVKSVRVGGGTSEYVFTNAVQNDVTGTNIYIRTGSGGELRATVNDTTNDYINLRAAELYSETTSGWGRFGSRNATWFHMDTDRSSFYMYKPLSVAGLTVRDGAELTGPISLVGSGTELLFGSTDLARIIGDANGAYIQHATEVRATKVRSTTYIPVRASSFPTGSLKEFKQDIDLWDGRALDIINNTDIFSYRLISDVEDGRDKMRYGLVIGDGYNTPQEVIDGDGVEQYAMNSISWKAIQEIYTEFKDEIESIKGRLG